MVSMALSLVLNWNENNSTSELQLPGSQANGDRGEKSGLVRALNVLVNQSKNFHS